MAGGVYQDSEIVLDEEIDITETGVPSRIDQIKDRIDVNFTTIFQALESARVSGYYDYQTFKNQYDELAGQYSSILEEVDVRANTSNNLNEQQYCISVLEEFLYATDRFRESLRQAGFVGDESIESEGLPSGSTAMVLHGSGQNGGTKNDIIMMENVGPARIWWRNLNPTARTLIMAGGIAGAIYGAKWIFGKIVSKRMEEN